MAASSVGNRWPLSCRTALAHHDLPLRLAAERLPIQLKLPWYARHGLRATGPVAAKMPCFENRVIRELTGEREDRTFEI